MKALLVALNYNTWFTTLIVDGFKEKEIYSQIAEVFQYNTTIKRIIIKYQEVPSQFFSAFANSLSLNSKTSLVSIDFEGNSIEVGGISGVYFLEKIVFFGNFDQLFFV